jgi:hypothetical protein
MYIEILGRDLIDVTRTLGPLDVKLHVHPHHVNPHAHMSVPVT